MNALFKILLAGTACTLLTTGCKSEDDGWEEIEVGSGVGSYSNSEPEYTFVPKDDVSTSAGKTLLQDVEKLEEELKKYGVHFTVKQRSLSDEGYGPHSKTYHEVILQVTASEADLKILNLKIEDRNALIQKFNSLMSFVNEKGLRDKDNPTNIAIIKIELMRSRIMLPQAIKSYEAVVETKNKNKGLLKFSKDRFGLALWDVRALNQLTVRTNGDILQMLQEIIGRQADFEKIKKDFFTEYVKEQSEYHSLKYKNSVRNGFEFPDTEKERLESSERISALKEMERESVATEAEWPLLTKLMEIVAAQDPADRFDFRIFDIQNSDAIHQHYMKLHGKLKSELNAETEKLAILFNGDSIDPVSVARAKASSTDFEARLRNFLLDLMPSFSLYTEFINDYSGSLQMIGDEMSIVSRITALMSLTKNN